MTKKPEVIRNPARQLNQMLGKRERYVPNYVKMGLDTPQSAKVATSDFEYAFNKRKPFVSSSSGKREDSTPKPPNVEVVAGSARRSVPKQVRVSSGFSHEHTWHPVAKYYDEETIPEDRVDPDEFPWEEDEDLAEEQVRTETINYDEIEVEQRQPRPEEEPRVKTAKYHQLSALVEGEYCIAVDGNIVHISLSLVEIEDMVEYILFDQNSPLGDISIESVSVFKRMSIKAGILVKD